MTVCSLLENYGLYTTRLKLISAKGMACEISSLQFEFELLEDMHVANRTPVGQDIKVVCIVSIEIVQWNVKLCSNTGLMEKPQRFSQYFKTARCPSFNMLFAVSDMETVNNLTMGK